MRGIRKQRENCYYRLSSILLFCILPGYQQLALMFRVFFFVDTTSLSFKFRQLKWNKRISSNM